jgi:hypothetical protein
MRRLSWIICLSGMLFGIVVGGSSWLLVIVGAIGVAAAKERSAVGRLSCAETAVTTQAPPTLTVANAPRRSWNPYSWRAPALSAHQCDRQFSSRRDLLRDVFCDINGRRQT